MCGCAQRVDALLYELDMAVDRLEQELEQSEIRRTAAVQAVQMTGFGDGKATGRGESNAAMVPGELSSDAMQVRMRDACLCAHMRHMCWYTC